MASTRHHPNIDLERLTGIHERHVCSDGEDSFTLAVGAARDCLEHSRYQAHDMEMLVNCSISKNKGGLHHHFEPPLSLSVKEAIGAERALSFDLSNACAGMMSGVLVLHDFIRRGVIQRGMVVSGEYISSLGTNAAQQIRSILSSHLASLTLGDAGAAVIVERAPKGAPAISRRRLHHVSGVQPALPRHVERRRARSVDGDEGTRHPQGRDRRLAAPAQGGARRERSGLRPDRSRDPSPDLGAGHPHRCEGDLARSSASRRSTW